MLPAANELHRILQGTIHTTPGATKAGGAGVCANTNGAGGGTAIAPAGKAAAAAQNASKESKTLSVRQEGDVQVWEMWCVESMYNDSG